MNGLHLPSSRIARTFFVDVCPSLMLELVKSAALTASLMNILREILRLPQYSSTNSMKSGSTDIDIIALIKGTQAVRVFNYYTGHNSAYRHHTNYSNALRKEGRYFSTALGGSLREDKPVA